MNRSFLQYPLRCPSSRLDCERVRTAFSFLVVVCALVFFGPAPVAEAAQGEFEGSSSLRFAELQVEYGKAMERLNAAEEKKLEELKQQYAKTLDNGIIFYMRRGDLESTLALRDERERFEEHGTIPPPLESQLSKDGREGSGLGPTTAELDDLDDGVIRTINRCRDHWLSIEKFADRQRLELNEYYAEKLARLEKRVTRQGRLDEAIAVSKERKRIAAQIASLRKKVDMEEEVEPEPWHRTESMDMRLPRMTDDLRQAITAYYPCDESGTTALDRSGNGRNGIAHGARWTESGKRGGCFYFDGVDDWIGLGGGTFSQAFRGQEAVAVFAWVRREPETKAGNLFTSFNGTRGAVTCWVERRRATVGARSGPKGEWHELAGKKLLPEEKWVHVGFVVEFAEGRMSVYVDGVLSAQSDVEFENETFVTTASFREEDRIGASAQGVNPFAGRIDEILVFTAVPPPAVIQQLAAHRGRQ